MNADLVLDRAPLHQHRWIRLAEGGLGALSAEIIGDKLEHIAFGVRDERDDPRYRYRITLTPRAARELRDWLDKQLSSPSNSTVMTAPPPSPRRVRTRG